jgi:hypothetical protein
VFDGKQSQEGFAKLFKSGRHFPYLRLTRIADEQKVFGLNARPLFFGRPGESAQRRNQQKAESRCQGEGTAFS